MRGAIILHGGAGTWKDESVRAKAEETVLECTKRGWRALSEENSLEAVIEAVRCMEDSGYLNAGQGSVQDLLGGRSLDAGIMTSSGLLGAVAGVSATRNPILLARIVAEETPHVLLAGKGADGLAKLKGLPPLPEPPPHVVERYAKALGRLLNGEIDAPYYNKILEFLSKNQAYMRLAKSALGAHDTVGAVAVDRKGLLAAATSTGGVVLKLPGRVGDTPIPGAGFYASSNIACSATGIGEYIIRSMPCYRLDLEYASSRSLFDATKLVMDYVNKTVGLDALGFIAVDREGRGVYAFNTEAMLIGYVNSRGEALALSTHKEKMGLLDV